jgi:hypothetical protein
MVVIKDETMRMILEKLLALLTRLNCACGLSDLRHEDRRAAPILMQNAVSG